MKWNFEKMLLNKIAKCLSWDPCRNADKEPEKLFFRAVSSLVWCKAAGFISARLPFVNKVY